MGDTLRDGEHLPDESTENEGKCESGQYQVLKKCRSFIEKASTLTNITSFEPLGLFWARKAYRRKYFDFGKPCDECKKLTHTNAELRCSKCFYITCLEEECLEGNDCNLLNEIMKKRTSEISTAIWNILLDKTQSQDFVNVQCTTSDRIHKAVVETTITLTKWFRATTSEQFYMDNVSDNCMKLKITAHDATDDTNQTVYVRLKDMLEMKIVGLYEKGGTDMELNLVSSFEKELAAVKIKTSVVKDVLGYLTKCDDHLIAVCLHQSRIKEDIHYTLESIKKKDYRRVVLVLLHFKIHDTDCYAERLQAEKCYSNLSIIDYFQHQEKENMEEVIDKIKEIIFGY